ncbi:transcription elongation factor NusA [Melioribacter roseus P3M-2]|jgi:N utilization substance protein A|uniref:Transcription termination/antitermination protein NusA n=1 Tax=Melioribacter roseus (strain DSM 23840 / JCM 17771 / VKM B-2668 / P3M-2) TaxID=1191523 RepID=I7A501_MELRP|nr:transcription termination factor NusA [Melioribacter roseus]AFN74951.1 transcription elongation factor NusA [Melioribacter roseus P3M-2]
MNPEIVESFAQMVREKSLDKDVLAGIIEEIFGLLVKKKFGNDARYDVVVNMDKGDIEIFLERTIVEKVEDPSTEISIDEVNARGNEEELEVGDDYVEKIELSQFGRRLINLARQNLNQKIREIEKDIVYNEYKEMIGEIVVGDIYQVRRNDVLVNHNKNELILPRIEQIPREKYKKGETIRAVVKEVKKNQNGPVIIISRADNMFLRRLFEIEIPEIYDGVIEIKGIAREPGERAKVAVESQDSRIDAVGACVGMKGVRIHAIVRELNNENIDVINYSDDPVVFIQRCLAPAKLRQIEIDEENKKCTVTADTDQISLIVGRNGVNIRLAMKLTGYDIEVLRQEKQLDEYEEDIELPELREELGSDIVDILISNRFETAVEVLKAGVDKLKEIEGIGEEKAKEIIQILENQFEEEE